MQLLKKLRSFYPKAFHRGRSESSILDFVGSRGSESADVSMSTRIDLIKSRPVSLEKRDQRLADDQVSARLFFETKTFVFKSVDQHNQQNEISQRYLKESGRMNDGRSYYFIQPLNTQGWLFEQTSTGWIISRAQKNVAANSFLRGYDHWDLISVFKAEDSSNTRLSSQRLNMHLVSPLVYQAQLVENLLGQV
jgi:hypothetical protein